LLGGSALSHPSISPGSGRGDKAVRDPGWREGIVDRITEELCECLEAEDSYFERV
jgi:hypothetical protein